ncbi:MAG TPA: serine hydrolase [Aeromonadales bacterium]|nr:serine hydrolase [Aeromonadales bacterium]
MNKIFLKRLYLLLAASLSVSVVFAIQPEPAAHTALSRSIDKLVLKTMQAYSVPGVAIGVIQAGKIVHLKGYGVASIKNQQRVNGNTLFKIASNSKAFTAAALALLVDEGKLHWQDKVVNYLPDFKMYQGWVTQQFNIRDLLTHRSGLRIGAGDLMLWPEPTLFTRQDIIKNLRFLKPVSSFRDEYAYDNLLYIVAGEVVHAISGKSWENFVAQKLFKPLNMQRCFSGGVDREKVKNLASPHAVINGQLTLLVKSEINNSTSLMAPAGGIKCSAGALLKWISFFLDDNHHNNALHISQKQKNILWQPVTPLPLSEERKKLDKTHFRGYALGWRVSDYFGHWRISHTGSLAGMMSQIIMLPDSKTGIVILTNQQSSKARQSLARGILQRLLNLPETDWVAYYKHKETQLKKMQLTQISSMKKNFLPQLKLIVDNEDQNNLLGVYADPWFGDISLKRENNNVIFRSKKSPQMTGKVYYYKKNQWWVKWDDRSFEADAWLYFTQADQSVKLTMKAISSNTDFSFDFQDLNFKKVSKHVQADKSHH